MQPSALTTKLPDTLRNAVISGAARMTGAAAAPVVTSEFVLTHPGSGTGPLRLAVSSSLSEGAFALTAKGTGPGIRTFGAAAGFPVALSLIPFKATLDPAAPLTGSVNARLDTGPLAETFLPPGQSFSGDLAASAALSGTVADPGIRGTASIAGGRYAHEKAGVYLSDIAAESSFTKSRFSVTRFSAGDGGKGRLYGHGSITPANSGTVADIAMRDFRLLRSSVADGVFDADIFLRERPEGYFLNGTIAPQRLQIGIPERFESTIPQLNVTRSTDRPRRESEALRIFGLDLDIDAPQEVFVRGWGLDAEFGGRLDVEGTLGQPLVNGSPSSRRGR